MSKKDLLSGKRILAVDDEPDVLATIEDLLPTCDVLKASSFDEAKMLLETQYFDMAILDIMGVGGYDLLKIANQKDVIAVMLTAHALSVENIAKSYEAGAASYLPKEKLMDIATFLEDILLAIEKGKDPWWRWLSRLASFWKKEFGPDWQHYDKEFFQKLKKL